MERDFGFEVIFSENDGNDRGRRGSVRRGDDQTSNDGSRSWSITDPRR